ncbi:hypothetical protein Hanom_Chr01g00088521 [Helianthus anomalus]
MPASTYTFHPLMCMRISNLYNLRVTSCRTNPKTKISSCRPIYIRYSNSN